MVIDFMSVLKSQNRFHQINGPMCKHQIHLTRNVSGVRGNAKCSSAVLYDSLNGPEAACSIFDGVGAECTSRRSISTSMCLQRSLAWFERQTGHNAF